VDFWGVEGLDNSGQWSGRAKANTEILAFDFAQARMTNEREYIPPFAQDAKDGAPEIPNHAAMRLRYESGTRMGSNARRGAVAWLMRRIFLAIVLSGFSVFALSQKTTPDEALLAKTRALYDSPFTRDLVSFDCAVQFDWKKHFIDYLGAVPLAATQTAERLQTIQHRVFVDRTGAIVSEIPKAPDLSGAEHGAELEQDFEEMVSNGLNAWIPFGRNIILPVGPTKYSFQEIAPGYRIAMSGPGLAATLRLGADKHIISGEIQLPHPMRFSTQFTSGPDGLLLAFFKTAATTDSATNGEAAFAYTYQKAQGFELPYRVTVTHPSTAEGWRYVLTDCKVLRGARGPASR